MASPWAHLWSLDRTIDFMNHGSYGATPLAVLEAQREWQRELESDPVHFMARRLERELDHAREAVGAFLDAEPSDVAFVTNATSGVNTVLASLALAPGDEILVTDHGYAACTNAARRIAERAAARVVTAAIPFPVAGPEDVLSAVLGAVTARTRVALFDHVTSPTALIFPVAELVQELRARDVVSVVDGAHAPGMLPLGLRELDADYYTGNFHKWCCAPKGAAFLWVRGDRQRGLAPLVTSHGARSPRTDRSRYHLEFDWTGTFDPSAILAVPFALDYLAGLVPGGWGEIRTRNRALALHARRRIASELAVTLPCPDSMVGSMATVLLGDVPGATFSPSGPFVEPLYTRLYEASFQVVVMALPALPACALRVSAHLYNDEAQFERLATTLREALA